MKFLFATTLLLASVMAMPSQLAAAPDATTEIAADTVTGVQGARSRPQNDLGKRDLVKESREAANEICSGIYAYFHSLDLRTMKNKTDHWGFEQDIAPIPSSAAKAVSAHVA
ncbi:uncharacterized protein Bfra_006203 [Botrytis fragariae]|uniref:Uncharacterized protein n=1 Tax=Botrytis fragariae TaxID=1964551 RepID=A0A8H6AT03_9HELO|nr:uncharacterized protein Bfra_006203 [Botrytis fragariae]KAF5872840.1 hypothetical protein Bfra_006203 [Botrytis fragariae]